MNSISFDNLFKNELFLLTEDDLSWKEALELVGTKMVDGNYIEQSYHNEMISNVEQYGPYIVVIPGLALAHARPRNNVLEDTVGVLISKKGINFESKYDPVYLILAVAAKSDESHLEIFKNLSKVFLKNGSVNDLLESKDFNDFFSILKEKGETDESE